MTATPRTKRYGPSRSRWNVSTNEGCAFGTVVVAIPPPALPGCGFDMRKPERRQRPGFPERYLLGSEVLLLLEDPVTDPALGGGISLVERDERLGGVAVLVEGLRPEDRLELVRRIGRISANRL